MPLSPHLKSSSKIYSGSGNLFLIAHSITEESFAKLPIEIDGILLYTPPSSMRIFNRDGSEAAMCGNGLRCFVQYLIDLGIKKDKYEVHTKAAFLYGWEQEGEICVTLPKPSPITPMVVENVAFSFVNTGVPHAVCTGELGDFEALGRRFMYHPAFGREGSNVTHYRVEGDRLYVRTFERGVNRITGACGTGSVAAALVAKLPSPIKVISPSKECLTVTLSPLTLQGKVTTIERS